MEPREVTFGKIITERSKHKITDLNFQAVNRSQKKDTNKQITFQSAHKFPCPSPKENSLLPFEKQ